MIKEGWLTKQGGLIKTWKRRWFVLEQDNVSYYVKQNGKFKGRIQLSEDTVISRAPECKKQPAFKISSPGTRTYYITGSSEDEVSGWIEYLKKTVSCTSTKVTKLEDFEVLRLIGRGPFGKVKLVRRIEDGSLFAMKSMSNRMLEEHPHLKEAMLCTRIWTQLNHQFLVNTEATFETENKAYFVMEYVSGGELVERLREDGKFSDSEARLYIAEIILAIGHLHSLGFIYRDLKPDNILIGEDGHIKITIFDMLKRSMDNNYSYDSFNGAPEYIAPEILEVKPYGKEVDWWSLGILLFELLTGFPPFYDENMEKMYQMILKGSLVFPHYVSNTARDLIQALLVRNPGQRLGSGASDFQELKKHKYFDGLDWDLLSEKKIEPEWKPQSRLSASISSTLGPDRLDALKNIEHFIIN